MGDLRKAQNSANKTPDDPKIVRAQTLLSNAISDPQTRQSLMALLGGATESVDFLGSTNALIDNLKAFRIDNQARMAFVHAIAIATDVEAVCHTAFPGPNGKSLFSQSDNWQNTLIIVRNKINEERLIDATQLMRAAIKKAKRAPHP